MIPGWESAAGSLGDGFATLQVGSLGTIQVAGGLADGTHFSRAARISQDGLWPLYLPLYNNKGSILSLITFSNQPASSLSGDLVWFKPAKSSGGFYPMGFTNEAAVIGSPFVTPTWVKASGRLNITNGVMILVGGNLASPLTNTFNLDGTATGTNRITMRWDPVGGAVTGSFILHL